MVNVEILGNASSYGGPFFFFFYISFTLSRGLLYSDLLDSFLTRRGYAVPAWSQADLTNDLRFNYVYGFAYLT